MATKSTRTEVSTVGGARSGHPERWQDRSFIKGEIGKLRRSNGKAEIAAEIADLAGPTHRMGTFHSDTLYGEADWYFDWYLQTLEP